MPKSLRQDTTGTPLFRGSGIHFAEEEGICGKAKAFDIVKYKVYGGIV
ncbi:hypothetical protein JXL19_02535 [bacterium]|nr:hypothetical protein [bacterium]